MGHETGEKRGSPAEGRGEPIVMTIQALFVLGRME